MKPKLMLKCFFSTLLTAAAMCLFGLLFDDANADPPDPTPSPAMDISTKLQPYQTPGVETSQSDGRLLAESPMPPEVEEPPISALTQQTFYAIADATAPGWTGQTDVAIRVTDPNGLSGTDTFAVMVSSQELPITRTIYLPLLLKNAGPQNASPPSTPVLNSINNSDGDGNYTASWSSADQSTGYVLQEDDNSSFSSPTMVYSGPAISATISGRAVGTYYYRVQATNSLGNSPWSNVVSVQVLPPTEVIPKPGHWSGSRVSFEVTANGNTVHDFTVEVYISGCGTYDLTWNDMTINNGKFSGGGVSGTFSTPTSASGSYTYFFQACNGWTLGTGSWSATRRY